MRQAAEDWRGAKTCGGRSLLKVTCFIFAAGLGIAAVACFRQLALEQEGKDKLKGYSEHYKLVASYEPGNGIAAMNFTWYLAKDIKGNSIYSRVQHRADTDDASHLVLTHDVATAYTSRPSVFNAFIGSKRDHVFGCRNTPNKYNATSNAPQEVKANADGTVLFDMANLVLKSNDGGDPTHVQHEVDGKNVWMPLLMLSSIPPEEIDFAFFICRPKASQKWVNLVEQTVIDKVILREQDGYLAKALHNVNWTTAAENTTSEMGVFERVTHKIANVALGTTWCGAATPLTTQCPVDKIGTPPGNTLLGGMNYDVKTDCCCRQHDHSVLHRRLEFMGYNPNDVPIRRVACSADLQLDRCAVGKWGTKPISVAYSPVGMAGLWGCLAKFSTISCNLEKNLLGGITDICKTGEYGMRVRSGIHRYSDTWDPFEISESLRRPEYFGAGVKKQGTGFESEGPGPSRICSECAQFGAALVNDTDYKSGVVLPSRITW